jgi:hypothetical protein
MGDNRVDEEGCKGLAKADWQQARIYLCRSMGREFNPIGQRGYLALVDRGWGVAAIGTSP